MKRLNTGFLVVAIAAGGGFGANAAFAQTVKPTASAAVTAAPPASATAAAAPATPAPATPAATATGAAPATAAATNTTTTTTTTTSTSTTTPASAAGQPLDGATYVVRLRDLETRIDELKEQIRRSHTRLSLLSDTILSGGVGGARAEISFRNDLSNAFRLSGVVFVLDGVVQYNRQDDSESGLLDSKKEIPVFSGSIPPGDHTLQVVLRLRGHGYGVFSYLRGYKFDMKSSHSFTVSEGKTVLLQTVAFEKGDVTTPLEQRPAVRHESNIRSAMVEAGRPSTSSAVSPPKVQGGASVTTGAGTGSVSGGASIGGGVTK